MVQQTIYLVPNEGTDPSRFKVGYNSNTVDIPFLETGIRLEGGYTYKFNLGFKTYAPRNADMYLMPRSSAANVLGNKGDKFESCHVMLANTIGYIDWEYRGDWIAMVFTPSPGVDLVDRKAYLQLVPKSSLCDIKIVKLEEVPEDLLVTTRGEGGFGSSDNVQRGNGQYFLRGF